MRSRRTPVSSGEGAVVEAGRAVQDFTCDPPPPQHRVHGEGLRKTHQTNGRIA
jgi:hypothetical protein